MHQLVGTRITSHAEAPRRGGLLGLQVGLGKTMLAVYEGQRTAAEAPANGARHTQHSDKDLEKYKRVRVGKLVDSDDEEQRHALLKPARMYTGFQLVDDERGNRLILPDGSVRCIGACMPRSTTACCLRSAA